MGWSNFKMYDVCNTHPWIALGELQNKKLQENFSSIDIMISIRLCNKEGNCLSGKPRKEVNKRHNMNRQIIVLHWKPGTLKNVSFIK